MCNINSNNVVMKIIIMCININNINEENIININNINNVCINNNNNV